MKKLIFNFNLNDKLIMNVIMNALKMNDEIDYIFTLIKI